MHGNVTRLTAAVSLLCGSARSAHPTLLSTCPRLSVVRCGTLTPSLPLKPSTPSSLS